MRLGTAKIPTGEGGGCDGAGQMGDMQIRDPEQQEDEDGRNFDGPCERASM
jgi:hypothetical protein